MVENGWRKGSDVLVGETSLPLGHLSQVLNDREESAVQCHREHSRP